MDLLLSNMDLNTGDEDVSAQPLAAAIVSFVVSFCFFAGRMASRRVKKHPFNASDYTLLVGMTCGWCVFGVIIYGSCLPEMKCGRRRPSKVLR